MFTARFDGLCRRGGGEALSENEQDRAEKHSTLSVDFPPRENGHNVRLLRRISLLLRSRTLVSMSAALRENWSPQLCNPFLPFQVPPSSLLYLSTQPTFLLLLLLRRRGGIACKCQSHQRRRRKKNYRFAAALTLAKYMDRKFLELFVSQHETRGPVLSFFWSYSLANTLPLNPSIAVSLSARGRPAATFWQGKRLLFFEGGEEEERGERKMRFSVGFGWSGCHIILFLPLLP